MKQKDITLTLNSHDQEIVKTLKQGPYFGFHGAKYANLNSIFHETKEEGIMRGHYFGVDENAKHLSDEEFYTRLYGSVKIAIGYSKSQLNEHGQIRPLPFLILGVDNHENKKLSNPIRPDVTWYANKDLFAIGHDFIQDWVDIHYLITPSDKLFRIQKKLINFSNEDLFGKAYFVQENLTKDMINRIYKKIKNYNK